jgi:hypothetical protein
VLKVAAAAVYTTSSLAAGDIISALTNKTGTVQTKVSSLCFLTALLVLYCSKTKRCDAHLLY